MTPTHATKGQRRYRYYATREATEEQPAWRVSAADLEQIVGSRIASYLTDTVAVGRLVTPHDPRKLNGALAAAQQLATNPLAAELIRSVALADDHVDIVLCPQVLLARLGIVTDADSDPIRLSAAVECIRSGHQLRLVLLGEVQQQTDHDEGLVQLLAEAHATCALVIAHLDLSINALA